MEWIKGICDAIIDPTGRPPAAWAQLRNVVPDIDSVDLASTSLKPEALALVEAAIAARNAMEDSTLRTPVGRALHGATAAAISILVDAVPRAGHVDKTLPERFKIETALSDGMHGLLAVLEDWVRGIDVGNAAMTWFARAKNTEFHPVIEEAARYGDGIGAGIEAIRNPHASGAFMRRARRGDFGLVFQYASRIDFAFETVVARTHGSLSLHQLSSR